MKKALEYFNGDELATKVWWDKYRLEGEETPKDMYERHATEIAQEVFKRIEWTNIDEQTHDLLFKSGKKFYKELKEKSFEEIKQMVIEYVNFDNVVLGGSMMQGIGNHKMFSSLSNCFVLGQPFDSYSGINKKADEITQVMKRRGGAGLDLSTLRPKMAKIHNQATFSDGPVLFAEGYSQKTKEVAQYGRRGALMLSLDIRHPDSLDFIRAKLDLTKITGANISVKLTDDFMQAVENDTNYVLRFPVDAKLPPLVGGDSEFPQNKLIELNNCDVKYIKIVRAKEYWNEIIKCAHTVAEPGILFVGNWEMGGTDWGYEQYRPISTNPCSEIPMPEFDACRLVATNLYSMVDNPFQSTAKINKQRLFDTFYFQMFLADVIVDLECIYIDRIICKIQAGNDPQELKDSEISLWRKIKDTGIKGRRCGCGFTALGDMLAALNQKYYSPQLIDEVFEIKMRAELQSTIDMSILYGPFEGFNSEIESEMKINQSTIDVCFPEEYEHMLKYGRRNVSWSTAAPNGSTSLMTQTTSGIEPLFMAYYKRRKKCIVSTDRVDYIDPNDGQKFSEYMVVHPKLIDWYYFSGSSNCLNVIDTKHYLENCSSEQMEEIFSRSPWFGQTANDLNWKERVKIQSIVQRYTTHAISSTINLPHDVDIETISNIYMQSWKMGLKGNTVYREGSRGGIIVDAKTSDIKSVLNNNDFYEVRAPKRPKTLPAHYYTIKYKNKIYSIIIGLLQDKPYEIFVVSGIDNLPQNFDEITEYISGEIVKESKDYYNFESKTFILKDIPDIQDDEKTLSIMLSGLLRSRTPIKFICKMLDKTKPIAGSFTHKLIKILSKYIPNGESSGDKCPVCGGRVVYENGCKHCLDCTYGGDC